MMQTICRFSLAVVLILTLTACSENKIQKEVKEKIKQVEQVKKEIRTLGTFAINLDKTNFDKVFKMEDDYESKLKVEIKSIAKDKIELEVTRTELITLLIDAKKIFNQESVDNNTMINQLNIAIFKNLSKKEKKVLTFNSVDEINVDAIVRELFGFDDLKTNEEMIRLIELYTPYVKY